MNPPYRKNDSAPIFGQSSDNRNSRNMEGMRVVKDSATEESGLSACAVLRDTGLGTWVYLIRDFH